MAQDLPGRDEFVAANRAWTKSFAWGGMDVHPRRALAILTCMDSRYTAEAILGLGMGDTHVIRNAGGRATDDAIRSLVLSAYVLDTRGCVVIHHTKCGLFQATNEAIHDRIRERGGIDASHVDFLPFDDMHDSVREDLARLRASRLLPAGYQVLGFVYDVDTGLITPVDEAEGGPTAG